MAAPTDGTIQLADGVGARIIAAPRGRGQQLAAGAEAARSDWLLFLHADTALEPGWESEAESFIDRASAERPRAAAFRFALDDFGFAARMLEWLVGLRCFLFGLPYGDQGLLISRRLYRKIGGYQPAAADGGRRYRAPHRTPASGDAADQAVTSAERFRTTAICAARCAISRSFSSMRCGFPPGCWSSSIASAGALASACEIVWPPLPQAPAP